MLSIEESALRLRDLANDILTVTRIEGGTFSYDANAIQAEPLINELSSYAKITLQSLGKSERVKVVVKTESSIASGSLWIDRTRMLQALENILNNSIKFTNDGQISIEATAFDYKGIFEIKISDAGPGIPETILPRLFEKFATKGQSDHPGMRGTGLGLFIAKSIIQAHGGDVFGHNNEGSHGATFVVRLPIATGDPTVKTGLPA